MSFTLRVKSQYGSYPVFISKGGILKYYQDLLHQYPKSQIGIITDTHLYSCYRQTLVPLFKKNSRVHLLTIPAGEKYKNMHSKLNLEKYLFTRGFDRTSVLIAWGGGVVGDLVGFLASTYMRGIPYYAFPTSVTAMVDSSIGGKTGIDTPFGKNLIGTLYPPKGVFIDVEHLLTLPSKEFINGCAEIAKYHFIESQKLGKIIRKAEDSFQPQNTSLMMQVIKESLKVKIKVVNLDENETGLRRILNFGHTFGHALEHLSHYRISHGFAVAIGMGVESFWSLKKKSITLDHLQEILSFLSLLKLPTDLPPSYQTPTIHQQLYEICQHDKKSQHQDVYFVCLKEIGKVKENKGQYRELISKKEFKITLKEYLKVKKINKTEDQ